MWHCLLSEVLSDRRAKLGLDGNPPPPRRRGLTRDAVVLGCGAGQPARQIRGELGRVAVAARHPQRPHRSAARPAHPARRLRASPPWRHHSSSTRKRTVPTLQDRGPGRRGGSEETGALNARFRLVRKGKGLDSDGVHFCLGQNKAICATYPEFHTARQ